MRVLIAGILGGIAMYVWATAAHLVTPLATMGMNDIPHDEAAVAALQASLGDKGGIYRFPSGGTATDEAAQNAYMAKLKTTAQGLVIYNKPGTGALTPRQMGVEAGLEVLESLLLAVVLAMAAAKTFGARLAISAAVGLIAAITTNLSYWNWYGFGLDYTFGNGVIEFVKYAVAGAVIAFVLGWRRKAA